MRPIRLIYYFTFLFGCMGTEMPLEIDASNAPPLYEACQNGMESSIPPTGWCYVGGPLGIPNSYLDAAEFCLSVEIEFGYGGLKPPSINSAQENEALSYVQKHKLYGGEKTFWIALKCGMDNNWYWADGEPWSGYTNFMDHNEDADHCDSNNDPGHFFNANGTWEKGQPTSVDHFVCSRKQELLPPVETSSSGSVDISVLSTIDSAHTMNHEPTDLTDHLSSLGTGTAIESSTAAHLMTIADTTSQATTLAPPETTTTPNIGLPPWGIVAISAVAILIIVSVLIIILVVWRRFRRLKAEIVQVQQSGGKAKEEQELQGSRYYNLPNKPDEWEIERRFVSIDYMHKLGQGAFGSVYLGRVLAKNIPIGMGRSIAELYELTNNNDTVAVKRLHETADSVAEREFRAEIDLMKAVGFHDRLVNILACVTINEPILLIVEYCANGDLLELLRERRNYMLEFPDSSENTKTMNVKKQIMFAVQIAYGLEYLSSQGFVHRDIAARNIMVDQQETCKIGDFGLCRAIGKEEENYHSQGGKLPLKWMSPEAIDNYQFSVASDVWSYGVLLFEIVTLGGTPYAGWPASELLHRLKRGERIERPDNCSENLFEVMSHCWSELPSERPSFTKLRKRLGVLLEDVNQDDYYLKPNAQANYYVLESNAS